MSWNKVSQFVQSKSSGILNRLIDSDSFRSHPPPYMNHHWRTSTENQKFNERMDLAKYKRSMASEGSATLSAMSSDIIIHIFYYLTCEDACKFRCCSKYAEICFQLAGDCLWRSYCRRKFGDVLYSSPGNYFAQYLLHHTNILDHEYQHVKSLAHCYHALSVYFNHHPGSQGVYGMVCDLFWAEDERVAMALSRNRYWAMPTIIVDTEERVYEFKKITANFVRNGPASFLPLSMAAQSFQDGSEDYRFMDNNPATLAIPGFMGYAINLLSMRKEHEFLKFTVLPILFKNLMVFDSIAAKLDYEESLDPLAREVFRGIGLDEMVDGNISVSPIQSRVYPCFRWRESRPCYYRNYQFLQEEHEVVQSIDSCGALNDNPRTIPMPSKICTHSCSANHSSCICRNVDSDEGSHVGRRQSTGHIRSRAISLSSLYASITPSASSSFGSRSPSTSPEASSRSASPSPTNIGLNDRRSYSRGVNGGIFNTNSPSATTSASAAAASASAAAASASAALASSSLSVFLSIDKVVAGIERKISSTKQTLTPLLASVTSSSIASTTTAGDVSYVSRVINDLDRRVEIAKGCYTIIRYSY